MTFKRRLRRRFVMWLGPKLPPCEEITKIVSASFDRPLTVKERLQKRLHFLFCAFCRRYGRQIKVLRDFTRSGANAVEEGRVPEGRLSDEARARLKQQLREAE